ncbi:hypothetical protein JCM16303_007164 [Sporobolomyces ruberrimus]
MASTVPSRIYLISKYGDVFLGLTTGVFAYYLYEKKLNRSNEDNLRGLIRWKLDQLDERKNKLQLEPTSTSGPGEWDELTRELGKDETK